MRTKDSSSTPARHSNWLVRLVRFPSTRRAEKALALTTRATECERKAFAYEQSGDFYKAGKMAGCAKVYNHWARSLTSNTTVEHASRPINQNTGG
jgi:hypothetical protein